MSAARHEILNRQRPFEVDPARVDHFELGPGEAIADRVLVEDPVWTLYALDPDSDRALLVRLPAGFDLTTQPFAYVAQFEHAEEVALVPMDRLLAMAEDLPRPAQLVHLFSTGRCGSTLASRIFAELEGVWSVSEPDAIAQLVYRRDDYDTPSMRAMLRAASLWSFRPIDDRDDLTCVLKYRSEALFNAVEYLRATPGSVALFLYRDLIGWVDSCYRFAQKHGVDVTPGSPHGREFVWPILAAGASTDAVIDVCDVNDPDTPLETLLAALWTMRIESYWTAAAQGRFPAFSYQQLNGDRQTTVNGLLEVLARNTAENQVRALAAYERDSQEGTVGARDREAVRLDDRQRRELEDLARRNPRVREAVESLERFG